MASGQTLGMVSRYHFGVRWRLAVARHLLDIGPTDIVLDAGCGDGFIAERVATDARQVIAVDLSAPLVERNSELNVTDNIRFEQCDISNLAERFGDGYFSKVICLDVLEHVTNVKGVVKAFFKVLRPGGQALLLVPTSDHHGHFPMRSRDAFADMLMLNGFEIEVIERVQMPLVSSLIYKVVGWGKQCIGWTSKDVDLYDATNAFNLANSPTRAFSLYKRLFPFLEILTLLDLKPYRRGGIHLVALVIKPEVRNKRS